MNKNKPLTTTVAAIRRLGQYHNLLLTLKGKGIKNVSASALSRELGIHETQIRRDLALTGVEGKPKVGHDLAELIQGLQTFLNINNTDQAFLVGVGHLGMALLAYSHAGRLDNTGIKIVAAFDKNPEVIGRNVHGVEVLDVLKLENLIKRMNIHVGIITTPPDSAQEVADAMVSAGILAIWNFSLMNLSVPEGIILENVFIETGLAIISRKLKERIKS